MAAVATENISHVNNINLASYTSNMALENVTIRYIIRTIKLENYLLIRVVHVK
jgi:hypothetical protein